MKLPMNNWIFSYRKEWLHPDAIAGLTTAAVIIPKAMAYATIAGLWCFRSRVHSSQDVDQWREAIS